MQRKILAGMLSLSIMFNLGITSVKANSLENIPNVWKHQNNIENILASNKVMNSEKTDKHVKLDNDKIIVEVDNDATNKQIKKALRKTAESYEVISGKFEIDEDLPKEKKERLQKYLDEEKYATIVEVDLKDGMEITEAKNKLESENIIEDVDYNYEVINTESYGVDDTYSGKQYHLSKIGVKTAWDTYSRSGYKETWVAVIDTGLYVSNKDFNGIYLKNYSVDIRKTVNGSYQKLSDSSSPDPDGHGTHVAGIIGAKGNNAFATVGVGSGWINDCCKIMSIKAINSQGMFEDTDLIKSIQFAIEHGAEVINMSLGGAGYNSQMQAVINNAYNAGVTVVAAKGNNAKNELFYPADYNHVISVSATDKNNKLAGFSNYGKVDIAAPGDSIASSAKRTSNTYVTMSGTSMAAPMVSATVALIRGMNYDLSVSQAENVLYETATNIGSSTYFGAGLVNTGYAVQKAKYLGLRSESIVLKSVTKTSAGNAKIKWSELYNAEGYCISRATSANGTYSRIAVVDDLSYVDKSVKKGKTYYYRVRGYMYHGHGSGTVNGKSAAY